MLPLIADKGAREGQKHFRDGALTEAIQGFANFSARRPVLAGRYSAGAGSKGSAWAGFSLPPDPPIFSGSLFLPPGL
jgi:hypothetical protein